MSDDIKAPERIWLDPVCGTYTGDDYFETDVEYIRADCIEALEAENARLRDALWTIWNMGHSSVPDHFEFRSKARIIARDALRAQEAAQ